MRRLNQKRKVPTDRSTNVKMPRVKDEKVAAESLLLLSEPSRELKMDTDDLLMLCVRWVIFRLQTHSQTTVNRLGWLGEPANFKEKTQRAAFISRHKGKISRDKGRCTRFKCLYKIILQTCVFYRVYR